MIRREWGALRVGQHVLVHDESTVGLPLVPGRVTEVADAAGAHEVAIRITTRGRSRVIRPSRLRVHLDEPDPEAHCWRCEAHGEAVVRARAPRSAEPPKL